MWDLKDRGRGLQKDTPYPHRRGLSFSPRGEIDILVLPLPGCFI